MILNCPKCNTRFAVDEKAIGEGRDVKCGSCAHQWFVDPNPLGDEFADFMPMRPPKNDEEEAGDLIATFEEAYEGKKRPAPEEAPPTTHTSTDGEAIALDDGSDDEGEDEGAMIPEFEEMADAAKATPNFAMPSVPKEVPPVPVLYKVAAGASGFLMLLAALLAFNIILPGFGGMLGQMRYENVELADIQVRKMATKSRVGYVVEGKIINASKTPQPIPTLHVALLDKNGEVLNQREYRADKMLQPGESTPFTAKKLDTAYKDKLSHILVELGSDAQLSIRN